MFFAVFNLKDISAPLAICLLIDDIYKQSGMPLVPNATVTEFNGHIWSITSSSAANNDNTSFRRFKKDDEQIKILNRKLNEIVGANIDLHKPV